MEDQNDTVNVEDAVRGREMEICSSAMVAAVCGAFLLALLAGCAVYKACLEWPLLTPLLVPWGGLLLLASAIVAIAEFGPIRRCRPKRK